MASGILALLDDVAAIAKLATASLDDIGVAAMRAGSKSAGVVIDDAAVTPAYVTGLEPARELPILWRIAKGSLFNKIIILLPLALLLSAFLPFLITPVLMIGGSRDILTPINWAMETADAIGGVFLASDHLGHTVVFQRNDNCVDDIVVEFLVDGQLPPKDTTCN